MTTELTSIGNVKGYGFNPLLAACRFTPSGSASQTLTHSFGIASVARDSTGVWTVTVANDLKGSPIFPVIDYVENDTTHYHFVEITAITETTGVFTCRHRSAAYIDVENGAPTASDTVDAIQILVYGVRP